MEKDIMFIFVYFYSLGYPLLFFSNDLDIYYESPLLSAFS